MGGYIVIFWDLGKLAYDTNLCFRASIYLFNSNVKITQPFKVLRMKGEEKCPRQQYMPDNQWQW